MIRGEVAFASCNSLCAAPPWLAGVSGRWCWVGAPPGQRRPIRQTSRLSIRSALCASTSSPRARCLRSRDHVCEALAALDLDPGPPWSLATHPPSMWRHLSPELADHGTDPFTAIAPPGTLPLPAIPRGWLTAAPQRKPSRSPARTQCSAMVGGIEHCRRHRDARDAAGRRASGEFSRRHRTRDAPTTACTDTPRDPTSYPTSTWSPASSSPAGRSAGSANSCRIGSSPCTPSSPPASSPLPSGDWSAAIGSATPVTGEAVR